MAVGTVMGAHFEGSRGRIALPEAAAWDWEDLLAHARLIVAVVCMIAVCLIPPSSRSPVDPGRLLIFAYFTFSLFNLVAVRLHWYSGSIWLIGLHVADLLLICLIVMLTGGVQSAFLGLYLFVLLAGACKWGFNGALLTSCVCVASLFSCLGLPDSRPGGVSTFTVDGSTFIATMALSAGMVSLACILGLLVEREQKQYGDGVVIASLVRNIIPEPSFRTALGSTLKSVRDYFDADQVRLALQEFKGEKAFAWDVTRPAGKNQDGVRSWQLTESVRQSGFAMPPEGIRRGLGLGRFGADNKLRRMSANRSGRAGLMGGRGHGSTVRNSDDGFGDLHIVSEEHSPLVGTWSMLATSFSFERKWLGRLTVYNPRRIRSAHTGLRFLEALVREVGPAIFNKFTVARLRSRAQARERVRLVQELHDGIVQSLIGLEMQINHLWRVHTVSLNPGALLEELHRLQAVLHDEIASVREEMQRIKPLLVEPSRFIEYVAGTIDKFQRDQGITARFVAETQEVPLSPRVCTELVRIVQEALVNIRKHSGARKVLVTFGRDNGHYRLWVEDDGRGFGFTGLVSSTQLDSLANCPLMVRERVRAIGGELMIKSNEVSGARLEILVPATANGRVFSDN